MRRVGSGHRRLGIGKDRLFLLMCFNLFFSCGSKDPTFQQYYVQGEVLYVKHCSNCHQRDGTGLGLVYPPLKKSDFMDENFEDVICMMKFGREGELVVNGSAYNQRMPGNPLLSDLEVAEIATYIYNSWDHQTGRVTVQKTTEILQRCRQ